MMSFMASQHNSITIRLSLFVYKKEVTCYLIPNDMTSVHSCSKVIDWIETDIGPHRTKYLKDWKKLYNELYLDPILKYKLQISYLGTTSKDF